MSEQTGAEGATTESPAEQQTQGDPAELGEGGKKALASEREARKAAEKSAAELKARLDQIEAANLSDLEKAQKQAQEAQESAARAATEALRWRTAAKFGISDEDAETFLTGSDEATITRQAERLAEFQKSQQSAPAGPRPDLSQGSKGEPKSVDPAHAFAKAFEGRF